MKRFETIETKDEDAIIGCDGGGGPLGHPLVYLRFAGEESVNCYYCGQRFEKSDPSADSTAQSGAK